MALVTISRWYFCLRLSGTLPGKQFAFTCLVPIGLLSVWIGIRCQRGSLGAASNGLGARHERR
jgi:hypothetical protein